ncbi:hypothetical protein BDZ94DRAFT_103114 [Collybia nuda]|uniref:Uncharacterized protein n=1 Tax=Collybia nuda TaxID=64659 RepID=A0A9P6CAJ1_9AGAR|nr:hypothetical protein BDZ94DRAFT_103114 [Collybia nuda]
MIRLPSSSRSVIASASRSPSMRINTETYSKSPTSHNNTTRTMGSPSHQMSRQASSAGFAIKIPPPRKQLSVPEASAIRSSPATPPPSVAPTNSAGKGHTSPSLEGPKTGLSIQNLARSGDSGPILQNLPITTFPNKLSVVPVAEKNLVIGTSLVNALEHAFTKNALGAPPFSANHSGRRRPIAFVSPVLTKATSDSSSMQMRQRNRDRELYTQRSKMPQESGERGKGRILDEDDWEDLLSANVVKVAFDKEANIQVNDHVRRSNLRHLLRGAAVPEATHPSPAEEFDKGGTEEGPMHLPPKFAKFAPSGGDRFLEMLEHTFGPDAQWGEGQKPKMAASDGDDSQAQSSAEQDGYGSDGDVTDVQVYGLGVRKRC